MRPHHIATPKKRFLNSSLAQPNFLVDSLTNSANDRLKRAKHNSVLNFSDGSQLRRSSIECSVKSTCVNGAEQIFTSTGGSTKGTATSKAKK
jgi:hypothetical protein